MAASEIVHLEVSVRLRPVSSTRSALSQPGTTPVRQTGGPRSSRGRRNSLRMRGLWVRSLVVCELNRVRVPARPFIRGARPARAAAAALRTLTSLLTVWRPREWSHQRAELFLAPLHRAPVRRRRDATAKREAVRVTCGVTTVSSLMRTHGVEERVDLLKLDVEGDELAALEGVEAAHWPAIERVCVEVFDIDGRLEAVQTLLRERGGYTFVWSEQQRSRTAGDGTRRRRRDE